jgi:hypothetical protein
MFSRRALAACVVAAFGLVLSSNAVESQGQRPWPKPFPAGIAVEHEAIFQALQLRLE